ncbi:histidine kinase [Runella slithyformis DSM 19594]|uniref:Histidine kinase n=1 Tax=Runella slithyformis (strain ATCC 29530 / DSM 19594 / LMG 11500 / NCIMB 11436 / LSU 4) TaxID=761193 RepID=A0A7U3ZQB5_RUNSL|nr:histidine kinase [Runella slithyformis DSM 19594]
MLKAHTIAPLQSQLRAARHDSTRLRLYTELARGYLLTLKLDSSAIYMDLGIKLSKQLNTSSEYSSLYSTQAHLFRYKKQYTQGIKAAQMALDFGKKNQQPANVERAGYALAIIYANRAFDTGNPQDKIRSIRQLFENIFYSNQHQSFTQIDRAYNLLYSLYKENGNDSLAYLYLEKQLMYTTPPKSPNLQLLYQGINTELHLYHKRNAEAEASLQQLFNIIPKKEDTEVYLYCLSEITNVCLKRGQPDRAFSIIRKIENSPSLLREMNNERRMIFNIERTAVYLYKKNYSAALRAHQQALVFAKKEKSTFGDRLKLLINQQKLFEYQQRFKEALSLNKRIHAMQDSLTSEQFSFELAVSEERLATEAKERIFKQQLKIQQLENQRKSQSLNQAQYILWATLLILVLLSVVVIIVTLQMKKIKKQSAALKELNTNKDRLFGIIGHDLRSPVIFLQMSLSDVFRKIPEKYTELSGIVSEQIARTNSLLSTLDNLLYWSVTQRDKISVFPRAAPLSDFVEEALDWLQQSQLKAEVTVYADIDPALSIIVDDNHMRIILRNLIHNAFKFTPKGGEVRLSASAAEDHAELFIRDTGPGFAGVVENTQKRGTQLGLKLVRELMQANHGTMQIESSSKGTLVKLSFPKA